MMTDLELLQMAAKAHGGIPTRCVGAKPGLYCCDEPGKPRLHSQWNPLTDDGDALRLAVKLKILVACEDCCAMGPHGNGDDDWYGGDEDPHVGVSHNECDPFACTRRAIVRAAAEIGRRMVKT